LAALLDVDVMAVPPAGLAAALAPVLAVVAVVLGALALASEVPTLLVEPPSLVSDPHPAPVTRSAAVRRLDSNNPRGARSAVRILCVCIIVFLRLSRVQFDIDRCAAAQHACEPVRRAGARVVFGVPLLCLRVASRSTVLFLARELERHDRQ
jgi:hypothetical protein